jgi:3-deoxy-D-manno-octulosonate 8-phosphate phosphatase (KDO 8-P phosphatase)
MKDEALAARCRALKLVLTDVDGVMTDGTVLLLPDGTEAKAFNIRDGLGVVLAHRAGLRTGLMTGRASAVVARRAAELGMAVVRQGVARKAEALREILAEQGLVPEQVAYIGDDVNDLPVLTAVGLSAAPADAALEVRLQSFMVTDARGGHGCLREFLEAILRARGSWDEAVDAAYGWAGQP